MSTSVIPRVFPSVARHASTSTATGKHKVVVIGGGAGGLAVANQVWNALKAQGRTLAKGDIAIIDVSYPGSILLLAHPPDFLPHAPHSPNSSRVRSSPVIGLIPSLTPQANPNHDYQPGWTVVGSGLANKHTFRRPLDSLIPGHIAHVHARASGFEPERNQVILEGGGKVGYDYLVVAPGLQTNYDKVKNLSSALSDPLKSKVSTIYSFEVVDKTWELIQSFKGDGEAIFTQPFGPVKCAGAPQKIAYMADSFWKQSPPAQKPHSTFSSGMPTMFSVPHYSRVLDAIREEKGITGIFNQNLIEVRPDDKTAVFEVMTGEKKGERVEREYGMLHVTPPMGPVDFVKSSALADGAGWVDVDAGTLQHKKYENVFSLGDASSLPTSKTAAAITAQSPVLSHNLLTHMSTGTLGPSAAIYDGYTSCPLFTGRGELLLAEFKYGLERKETFGRFVDQSKPNRAFYHLTKDVFPRMYFSKMLKGEWYGPKGLFPPQFVPS